MSSKISHIGAREILQRARPQLNREALLLAQGWGYVESGYGQGWRGEGRGSNNWGAIQATGWKGASFVTRDSSPLPDGSSRWYTFAYRKYATPEDGAADLCRVLFDGRHAPSLSYASAGDLHGFCTSLYSTHYYEGHGATVELRTMRRRWALLAATIRIARATGQQLADGSDVPLTFRDGESGPAAERGLQLIRALGSDSVKEFQQDRPPNFRSREMPADGVCGPGTWALILTRAEDELPVVAQPDRRDILKAEIEQKWQELRQLDC